MAFPQFPCELLIFLANFVTNLSIEGIGSLKIAAIPVVNQAEEKTESVKKLSIFFY